MTVAEFSTDKKAIVFLADGCEEVEALTVVDLLRRAGIPLTTVSVKDTPEITSSHNVHIIADTIVSKVNFDEYDCLILPGGMPGTKNEADCVLLTEAVKQFYNDGREVCAICAAPTILAGLGLLEGKRATCFPSCEPNMHGAIITGEAATETGNIITGRSMGCAIPFALRIIAHYLGEEKADQTAASVVYSGPRI